MTPGAMAALAVAAPVAGVAGILLFRRSPNLREGVTFASGTVLLALVLGLVAPVREGKEVAFRIVEVLPGVPLELSVEPLGMIFALVASILWILNSLYSVGYMRSNGEAHQTRFYSCFALAIASAVGVAFAGNAFSLFVFYETLTLSTYPLVTHKGTPEAVRAGRTYLGVLLGTSVCLQLLAILWIHSLTPPGQPSLAGAPFRAGGVLGTAVAAGSLGPGLAGLLYIVYVYGIGKAALMPVHRWLPAAMVAPTPVSALLHAVAVVKAGVFCVLKVTLGVFGVATLRDAGCGDALVAVAGATILAASSIALFQDNLKRRLAYSTVSQLSYVVLGTALLTRSSIAAAAFHLAAHAFGKITLFFAAGSIYTATHRTEVSQLDGIGRRMPWTMGAFAVGAISMIGLPPAAGFLSKWFLIGGLAESAEAAGAWGARDSLVLAVLVASTLLNAGYFLPILHRAFFREPPAGEGPGHGGARAGVAEAPLPIVVALVATAVGTLVLFLVPGVFWDLAYAIAEAQS